jgi:hypothetical protein
MTSNGQFDSAALNSQKMVQKSNETCFFEPSHTKVSSQERFSAKNENERGLYVPRLVEDTTFPKEYVLLALVPSVVCGGQIKRVRVGAATYCVGPRPQISLPLTGLCRRMGGGSGGGGGGGDGGGSRRRRGWGGDGGGGNSARL